MHTHVVKYLQAEKGFVGFLLHIPRGGGGGVDQNGTKQFLRTLL